MNTIEIIYASWYFSDRWGGKEESGCSLHLTLSDFDLFVKNYHNSFTNERVIGSYFIPRKPQTAKVSKALYERILSSKNGLNVSADEEVNLIQKKELIL